MLKQLRLQTLLVLLLLSSLSNSCAPKATVTDPRQTLATVANALNAISTAASGAVDGTLIVMPENTPERQQILGVVQRVVQANMTARNAVRGLNDLDLGTQQNLSYILSPVFKEFHAAVDSGVLGFKNPEMKAKVQGYIDAISAAVNILETVLNIKVGG